MKEAYKDHSVFQGIYQYFDESGQEWRIEKDGRQCKLFEENGGIFIHVDSLMLKDNAKSIFVIHHRFMNLENL